MKTQSRAAVQRRYPIGAELHAEGVHFRVWAPSAERVAVITGAGAAPCRLERESGGYHAGLLEGAGPGTRYQLLLDQRGPFPDPASRFQPDGPHGPSEVIDPGSYEWRDAAWRGVGVRGQVIYELHIGTFTPEGTWSAAAERLEALAQLGITVLEIMPVAEFPGGFGWGYDGVALYAPTRLYGRPDDFRSFVDRAHALGLGVILDVVYNHIGPDGNYLKEFAPSYFTKRYRNEWGEAINFDGDDAAPVREFFITNAAYWTAEYHIDGLRLDATQQIHDASTVHILAEVARAVRGAARGRRTYVTAENETQTPMLLEECGLDALWNDDFHHSARVALTGRREAYYTDYQGAAQEFVSALKHGFLFQGQYYSWQKHARGQPARGTPPYHFIHFIENHDQVANSATGARLHQLADAAQYRALTALLLLGPQTPLLFQGQEYGSSRPFLFFADHNAELAHAVAAGRAEFLSQFPSVTTSREALALPHDPATFGRCKLDVGEMEENRAALALHADLIRLRRTDPVIGHAADLRLDGAVIAPGAFMVRYFADDESDRLLIVNLGELIDAASIADPLIAPSANRRWRLLWSSEDVRYGGGGTVQLEHERSWRIPGHSATLFACDET